VASTPPSRPVTRSQAPAGASPTVPPRGTPTAAATPSPSPKGGGSPPTLSSPGTPAAPPSAPPPTSPALPERTAQKSPSLPGVPRQGEETLRPLSGPLEVAAEFASPQPEWDHGYDLLRAPLVTPRPEALPLEEGKDSPGSAPEVAAEQAFQPSRRLARTPVGRPGEGVNKPLPPVPEKKGIGREFRGLPPASRIPPSLSQWRRGTSRLGRGQSQGARPRPSLSIDRASAGPERTISKPRQGLALSRGTRGRRGRSASPRPAPIRDYSPVQRLIQEEDAAVLLPTRTERITERRDAAVRGEVRRRQQQQEADQVDQELDLRRRRAVRPPPAAPRRK